MEEKFFTYFGKSLQYGLVVRQRFPLFDESPENEHVHFDGGVAVENVGGHQRAAFGEGMGEGFGELEVSEGITFCDHLGRRSIRIMIFPSGTTTS